MCLFGLGQVRVLDIIDQPIYDLIKIDCIEVICYFALMIGKQFSVSFDKSVRFNWHSKRESSRAGFLNLSSPEPKGSTIFGAPRDN